MAQTPGPVFSVQPDYNAVWLEGWEPGSDLTITIYDDNGSGGPGAVSYGPVSTKADGAGNANVTFEAHGTVDFPGRHFEVAGTVFDGTTSVTKTHRVPALTLDVDPSTAVASGTTDLPGEAAQFDVWGQYLDQEAYRLVGSPVPSDWTVDLAAAPDTTNGEYGLLTPPLEYGGHVVAVQVDDDGDRTEAHVQLPTPRMHVNVGPGTISLVDFEAGEPVIVDIYFDGGWMGPWTAVPEAQPSGTTEAQLDLHTELAFDPGMVVKATQDTIVKEHTVTSAAITNVEEPTDPAGPQNPSVTFTVDPDEGTWNVLQGFGENGSAAEYGYDLTGLVDAGGADTLPWSHTVVLGEDDAAAMHHSGQVDPPLQFAWLDQFDEDGDSTVALWGTPPEDDGGGGEGDDGPPRMHVIIGEGPPVVLALGWSEGTSLHLAVRDGETPVYEVDATVDEWSPWGTISQHLFDMDDFVLRRGMTVELTGVGAAADGSDVVKTHTVTDLVIDDVDLEYDLVRGSSATHDPICVDVWTYDPEFQVTSECASNSDGSFEVDFSGVFDLTEETRLGAFDTDEDGDATQVDWWQANPRFQVEPVTGTIHGEQWATQADVSVTIDDPGTAEAPDVELEATTGTETPPGVFEVGIDPMEFAIEAGHLITVTDGTTTKSHVVTGLTATAVDVDADTVTGTAAPNTSVHVGGGNEEAGADLEVITDLSGVWTADFTYVLDIQPGMGGDAAQQDDDGDATVARWEAPPMVLWAEQYDDVVGLHHDHVGVPFDVVVSGLADGSTWSTTAVTEQHGWFFWENGLFLDLGAVGLDVITGTTVELFEPATGHLLRSLTVSPLTVTSLDPDEGAVSGLATPGAAVELQLQNSTGWAWRATTADASGKWTLHPGDDPGPWGEEGDGMVGDVGHRFEVSFQVEESDADGDRTRVDWEEYRMGGVVAFHDDDIVLGERWTGLHDVTVTVYDGDGGELFSQGGYDTTRDPGGPIELAGLSVPFTGANHVVIDLADEFDLQSGQRVELTDSLYTTDIVLPDITVTEVDLAADTVSGTGTPGEPVMVWALEESGRPRIRPVCPADDDGSFTVDFGTPLEPPVYLDCLLPGEDIWADTDEGLGDAIDLAHGTVAGGFAAATDSFDPYRNPGEPDDDDAAGVTWTTHLTDLAATPTVAEVDVEPVTFTARVAGTEPSLADELLVAATVDWGDGTSSTLSMGGGTLPAPDADGNVTLTFAHTFTAPGVHTQRLTATFADGHTEVEVHEYVAVYDPDGGFVTGGGWIDSPAGAYAADETLSGRATFGFVAKYHKGADVPDGNTQFQFHAGDLEFHSTSYDWLVVAGHDSAKFKGDGAVNGASGYQFMLTVDDREPDTFRIKIWHEASGEVVYDNGSGGTPLGGGSVVVHTKGK